MPNVGLDADIQNVCMKFLQKISLNVFMYDQTTLYASQVISAAHCTSSEWCENQCQAMSVN
jgi:membrane-bound inhibitor of C-type lysozyme